MSASRLVAAVLTTLLCGCAVGPDFVRPAAPTDTGYGPGAPETPIAQVKIAGVKAPTGEAQSFHPDHPLDEKWWRAYGSHDLDMLVEQALAASPTIAAAQAALRQASAMTSAQIGYFLPSVTAGAGVSRNLTATGVLAPASASGNPYYTLFTGQLGISYVVDVFGATRRALESLQAQEEQARFQLEATRITLANNVVGAAIGEASLRAQIAATEASIDAGTRLLVILRRQAALGQVAVADVVAQQAALAQLRQALPPLNKQLSQQRDMLAALVGQPPSRMPSVQFSLDDLQLPTDLPSSLPAQLVDQRPDVRAAEAALHAASAQVGMAVAARLPQLQLGGVVGNSPAQFDQFFTPGTNFWTTAAGLTGPIFDGGTLMFREHAAQAAFDQAAAQYRATAIAGMQNVADTLAALNADAASLAAAADAERAASDSLRISRRQLELGQIAYTQVLNAEQSYQNARLALAQARASRLIDTAALFQALGGGWWNRPAPAPSQAG